ncbi:M56 family metallopeptidase [Clostridium sp.]|uniref:M56 family metallopeptidase n=1 Tax=Clostridium sp. TaxID=1506 RepID=UPI003F4CA80B
MRQDLEISCDARVISYLDKGKNLQYGDAIVRVLELRGSNNRLIGTTSMVMNSSEIKRRIIMISKYKKANIKNIVLGAIIVIILGGIGIALNTSKSQEETSVKFAKEFVESIYAVDAKEVADFKIPMPEYTGEQPMSEEDYKKHSAIVLEVRKSIDKEIVDLMTDEGYMVALANQFKSVSTRTCAKGNYTAQVTDITLGEDVYKDYKDNDNDKVRYPYEVKFDFISSDGKTKQADTAKGVIELVKEDGTWKVCAFGIKQFPELYLQLFKNK